MAELSLGEQIKILIAEEPGISSSRLATFFEGIPHHGNAVSAALSTMYAKGGYRRERSGKAFCYWPDPDARPEPVISKARQQTANGAAHECGELRARIAELEAWKAEALARFPVLAVPPLVLMAREIVAEDLREHLDPHGAEQVMAGRRDDTAAMRATVKALERGQ